MSASVPIRFDRLGLDEGLSQQDVKVIAQDPTGFLWLGTEDGLNRYDGYTFLHFRHDSRSPASLPSSYVTDAAFDGTGKLWVATDGGGVVARDPVDGAFNTIEPDPGNRDGLDRVRAIHFDRAGRLWLGTRDHGVVLYSLAAHTRRLFRHVADSPATLDDDAVFALLEDRRGHVWVGTASGLNVIDVASGKITHHALELARDLPESRTQVQALLQDRFGVLWIATTTGLESFDPRTLQTQVFRHDEARASSLPSSNVNRLLEDSAGRLWIGTTEGLALFNRAAGTFDTYRCDPADPNSLPDDNVVSLFEDRGGLLWVGTKKGVAKWNPRSWSFGHHPAGAQEGMTSRFINAFTEDHQGRLWIATFGGGIAVVTKSPPGTIIVHHEEGRANSLGGDRVMTLLTDRAGYVWAGTMGDGLSRVDPLTLDAVVYRHDPLDPHSLGATGVMSLLQDSKGRMWVGTYGGGLSGFEAESNTFRRYLVPGSRITALVEDSLGYIWAGTDGGGVNILDPQTGKFTALRHDPRDATSLSGNTVYALHVDATGTVWVGTRDGGLDRAIGTSSEPWRIRFANFSEASGLPNDTVYGIESDSAGLLWLSTNHGLASFDPRTSRVRSFHRFQGLQADEFNFGAHYRTRAGELLFGGENGYNQFEPARLQFNTVPPAVALSGLLGLDREGGPAQPYDGLRTLHLGYRYDAVTFEFAALDFATPATNVFQYRLQGFDHEWVNAGARRSVTYTRLAGGHYTLHVRAANADGVWNKTGWVLPLLVDPPPWSTWWAYSCYTLLGLSLPWMIWIVYSRKLQREAVFRKQLEQQVRDRTEELDERTRQLAQRNAELESSNAVLQEVSLTDSLTGLGNRRSLQQALPGLLASVEAPHRAGRWSDNRLAVMIVDLDRFKPINDQHGHEGGDQVLLQLSAILTECVRAEDKVVRWGGDEFVVVHTADNLEGAAALAERIRAAVAKKRFLVAGTQIARTSVSIGFACYPFVIEAPQLVGWDEVLHVADTALYRAKVTRNAWVGWSGTRSAATLTDLVDRLEGDAEAAEQAGYIESRASVALSDETVEMLWRKSSAYTR